MMYFILWVAFLLIVILSVPIASWIDQRKLRAAYQSEDELMEEEEEVGEVEMEQEPGMGAAEEVADVEVAEGGEFAEFEEIN